MQDRMNDWDVQFVHESEIENGCFWSVPKTGYLPREIH